MLTIIEQNHLNAYKRGLGNMTADEAMLEALWNEYMSSKMPRNDPAHTRYKNEIDHYFNYAALLEKQAQP